MDKVQLSSNVFENFAFEFADIISRYKYHSIESQDHKVFFKNNNLKNILEPVKISYSVCEQLWDDSISFSKWISLIQLYSKFIRTMEKCFMYRNESIIEINPETPENNSSIYSEFNKKDNEEILYIKLLEEDVKIKFTFKESMISNIVPDGDESNILKNYLEGKTSSQDNQHVTFINIFITREFGKQVSNEFNFIYGEEPIYNDYSDEVLMNSIRTIVSKYLRKLLSVMCYNILKYSGLNGVVYKYTCIDDMFNGDYYIE